MTDRPIPPKIAPKPGFVKVVRALYDYTAQQDDELTFSEGDILYIEGNGIDPDWMKARSGNKSGLIPANYVESKADAVENPVHDAARRGNMEFLQECLENGVSATGLDASGNSPLHWAARGGHHDCAVALIQAGIKQFRNPLKFINTPNRLGDSALHMAAGKNHLDIVKTLLENGADPRLLNKEQQMAVDLAHDPAVITALQTFLLHPNENDVQEDDDYLDESEDD